MPKGLNRNGKREYLSIVVHCSASNRDTTTPQDVEAWHRAKGWNGPGYHSMIDGAGKHHVGRQDPVIGAGAEGWNEDSLHICVFGDFDKDKIDRKHPQYLTLVQVVAAKAKRYGIPVDQIIGHRDVYKLLGQRVAKTCPGANLYALLPALREDVAKYLA